MNNKPNSAETIARRVGTRKANNRARMRAALERRRSEISNLRSETAEAVNEMVQVAFEKFGGKGDSEPYVLRGRKRSATEDTEDTEDTEK